MPINNRELNVYAVPATLTLVLLVVETIFLMIALPETRGKRVPVTPNEKPKEVSNGTANGAAKEEVANGSSNGTSNGHGPKLTRKESVEKRISILKTLRRVHFLFLCLFSGIEFTLTFLTFDRKPYP